MKLDIQMKLDMPHIRKRINKYGKVYFYFDRCNPWAPLPGLPGSREFGERYDELMRQYAPNFVKRFRGEGRERGTISWCIEQFTSPTINPKSAKWASSTRTKYLLRFGWLERECGDVLLSALDRDAVRGIRKKLQGDPTVANDIIERIGALWRWADEYADLTGAAKLTTNPIAGVQRVEHESQSAEVWPEELCERFERCGHDQMLTFYFLARYTGQRRGDCIKMDWRDYRPDTNEIYVVQEKTGTKVWVACHYRLRDHLNALPGDHDGLILPSPRNGRVLNGARVTTTVTTLCEAAGFKGFSPHGLRHGAAVALAEAGCNTEQIMAITGHTSRRLVELYVVQANKRRMGHDAVALWEASDRKRAAAKAAAGGNVRPFRRPDADAPDGAGIGAPNPSFQSA